MGLVVSIYQLSVLTLHDLISCIVYCITMIMIVEGREVSPSWKQISHLLQGGIE